MGTVSLRWRNRCILGLLLVIPLWRPIVKLVFGAASCSYGVPLLVHRSLNVVASTFY